MIDQVEEYLRLRNSMVLAIRVDGEVRASTLCFAVGEGMTIYSLVFRDSTKHRGLMQSHQVSAIIDDGFQIPMRGVEIIGMAELVTGTERDLGEALLTKRYPDLRNVWGDPRILIVRLTPSRVLFTDWTHGVGESREASLTPRPPQP